jgi:hypothetical protein
MRALTVEELGFVSGGSATGPAVTQEGWSQLGAFESYLVTGIRNGKKGGGNGDFANHSVESGSFADHWMGKAMDFGGMDVMEAARILGDTVRMGRFDNDGIDEYLPVALVGGGILFVGAVGIAVVVGGPIVTVATIAGAAWGGGVAAIYFWDRAFGDPSMLPN